MSEKTFPCLKFKVDLKGGFGECQCGFIQVDHKPEKRKQLKEKYLKENAGKKPSESVSPVKSKSETPQQQKVMKDDSNGACEKYEFDPTKAYNTCKCGFTKKQHEDAKIRREKEKAEQKKKETEAAKIKSPREIAMENEEPCPEFEVDLINSGGYGTCICGFTRQDHQDFKSSPEVWKEAKRKLQEPKPFI